MQTRRDLMQAYRFAAARLVQAVAAGDLSTSDVPFRRGNFGVMAGAVIGVLIGCGALVFGLISPAPDASWRASGSIVVEEETGTRYVYLNGVLYPTANYASALLASDQASSASAAVASGSKGSVSGTAAVHYVSRADLGSTPIGSTIGIVAAPDAMPLASALLPGSWALCVRPDGTAVLQLDPAGLGPGPGAQRLLVEATGSGESGEYLVWNSVKYPVPHPSVLPALGLGDQQPIAVPESWLGTLQTGAAVEPAPIPGAGGHAGGPAGTAAIGSLYQVSAAGSQQYYTLLADGLAPINATEEALFTVSGQPAPTPLSAAAAAAAPQSADRSLLSRLPDFLSGPVYASTSQDALCAAQTSPGRAAQTRVEVEPVSDVSQNTTVQIRSGSGMLAEIAGAQSAQQGTGAAPTYFVGGSGEAYPIDSAEALAALGYQSATPVQVPAAILGLIPLGPTLDVDAARKAVTWPSG